MIITDNNIDLLNNMAVAVGVFDGVHLAHRQLIEYARQSGKGTAVFTFDHNPKNARAITEPPQRNMILQNLGVDVLFESVFNKSLREMSPHCFMETYLKRCGMICVGFNFRFGNGRRGTVEDLKKFAADNGIEMYIQPAFMLDGEIVSSTLIRKLLLADNLKKAARLLGRDYSVRGTVKAGDKIGRTLGFPTLNLEQDGLLVRSGVYATKTVIGGISYPSVTNVGGKPTVRDGVNRIETHAIGYSGDAYGKEIEVRFVERMRDTIKFESLEKLKQQLENDKKAAEQLL